MREIEIEFRHCFNHEDKKRIFPERTRDTDYKQEVEKLSQHVRYIQKQID